MLPETNLNGPPALVCRNSIIQAYSPLVSLISSHTADELAETLGFDSFLQLLRPFGCGLEGLFKTKTPQLVTKTFSEFSVRFLGSIMELLSVQVADSDYQLGQTRQHVPYPQLYKQNSLELLMAEYIKQANIEIKAEDNPILLDDSLPKAAGGAVDIRNSIYLKYFTKLVSSPTIVSFETFNHPVAQLFVVSVNDQMEKLAVLVHTFKHFQLPKYINPEDILLHVCIVSELDGASEKQFQQAIKAELGLASSVLILRGTGERTTVRHAVTSIEEDLQDIHLPSHRANSTIYATDAAAIREFVANMLQFQLLPFMERRILSWDDQVVSPRKSITGKFFSVSKRMFGSGPNPKLFIQQALHEYNAMEGFYHHLAPEQIIRKAADWLFMMRDYKTAYANYELLKKDFLTSKAWAYSASAQEFAIVAMLMGTSYTIPPTSLSPRTVTRALIDTSAPITNLTKVCTEIVAPYLDNLSYSYLSRANLRTFNARAIVVIGELLLGTNPWYVSSLTNVWLTKLIDQNIGHIGQCLVHERISYAHSISVHTAAKVLVSVEPDEPEEEDTFVNSAKLPERNYATMGLTRDRKAALWALIASREWDPVAKPTQVALCLQSTQAVYDPARLTWIGRENELLGKLQKGLSY
ncbi:hypothetical protein BABINDRAFT_175189 [Babjeviella inositovora NRRL Y-12698]|uniref:Uncharacterized protein n=1 Tax=Babjeviella inositovora NRRL Y-12698 TaxID=984486 RepID=A0A1E3QU79_9ASCO|nr:uncharacterized protein BABINDRAFT_175189 [Babjeviella inositovora NRRL Y-12698]ODQ80497.1 hypothetical protein BABINDRAFT_175189 [Babjeviella inositovora NRRL Y-12698]